MVSSATPQISLPISLLVFTECLKNIQARTAGTALASEKKKKKRWKIQALPPKSSQSLEERMMEAGDWKQCHKTSDSATGNSEKTTALVGERDSEKSSWIRWPLIQSQQTSTVVGSITWLREVLLKLSHHQESLEKQTLSPTNSAFWTSSQS